jgi:hypothetical protein
MPGLRGRKVGAVIGKREQRRKRIMKAVRSRVHMLTVAAARLEQEYANPIVIADLRKAAEEAAKAKADGRDYGPEDKARIEHQREAFRKARSGLEIRDLLLQRAYDLMWDGDRTACDAIAEFLPEADVQRMFDAWESDQMVKGDGERSSFYSSEAA